MMDRIPLARPFFDGEELEEIRKVLDSGWVSQGPKVKEFESNVARHIGSKYVIAVTNCTAALHLANLSIGISQNDEVIVADYTFPATGHSVLYCNAKPVFVDVDPRTYNIDPAKIEEKITEKTKAIIPVHTFGQSAEINDILTIAEKYNLFIIEDAACAFGAKYRGDFSGTLGDIGCFSLHARKGITTGEGGIIVTDNEEFAESMRHLSVFGMKTAWDRKKADQFLIPEFCDIGFNYKMSDITAAVGVAQLKKLNKIIDKKIELAHYWDEKLENIDNIEKPYVSHDCFHIYQSYVALLGKKINRNKIIEKMGQYGIQTQIGTYSSHIQPVYQSKDKCPTSFDIYVRSIALPIYYGLKKEEIDLIADRLGKTIRDYS